MIAAVHFAEIFRCMFWGVSIMCSMPIARSTMQETSLWAVAGGHPVLSSLVTNLHVGGKQSIMSYFHRPRVPSTKQDAQLKSRLGLVGPAVCLIENGRIEGKMAVWMGA